MFLKIISYFEFYDNKLQKMVYVGESEVYTNMFIRDYIISECSLFAIYLLVTAIVVSFSLLFLGDMFVVLHVNVALFTCNIA